MIQWAIQRARRQVAFVWEPSVRRELQRFAYQLELTLLVNGTERMFEMMTEPPGGAR